MKEPIVIENASPAPAPKNEIVHLDPVSSTLALVREMALNKDVDADKMDKILNMQIKVMDKQAEIDFTQALVRLMPKMPVIDKKGLITFTDKNNVERKTPFAKYEDIDKILRPLLIEEGFTLIFDSEYQANQPPVIKATLLHKGGHQRMVQMPLQVDMSGSKNALQGMGSTLSYGKRYLVTMLFNIITHGEDDDGSGAAIIDTEQAAEIDNLIAEAGTNKIKWLEKTVKVKDVREIKEKDYGRARNSLIAIIYDKQQKAKAAANQ